MGLSKKLGEWQEAKLIDSATADKISDFEALKSKPIALWAFGGLGAFAIILGLVSVVASNWMQTPDWVKLAADLVLCLAIALTLYRVISKEDTSARSQWLREILVIFYYGFTLASMALIGQTYQLGGSIAKLLLVWTLLTIPIVLLGRGKFLAVLWIVGISTTYAFNINAFEDILRTFVSHRYLLDVLLGVLYVLSPFFFILLSRIPWLVKHRPVMAGELSRYSWLAIIIGGWFCHFLWYESINGSANDIKSLQIFLAVTFFATAAMTAFIPKLYATRTKDTHLAMRVVLIATFIIGATALWHDRSYPVIGAIINIAYMIVLAWAALKIHSIKLFNVMTALICIRLLFIYFEVFGSMLETGIGLVVGGVITLLVVWGWFKKADSLAQYFGLSQTSKREGDA
ncbi:MAG: DUF2157 domain-containing protein [Methylophaga sp.]|nr:DUF2157 domain-containing protein [Methylophaga sp.]